MLPRLEGRVFLGKDLRVYHAWLRIGHTGSVLIFETSRQEYIGSVPWTRSEPLETISDEELQVKLASISNVARTEGGTCTDGGEHRAFAGTGRED